METVFDHAAGVAGASMKKLTSAEMAEHRDCVHAEARERISEVGGALRVSLNNMTVGSLREYIALSRHQLELSEYVNVHTGESEDPDDLWIQKIDWPTGQYHPFRMATRPLDQDGKALPAAWAVEQLRDVMWRVKAVGQVLGRSGKHLVATDADGLTELSNHQCEIADFMRTGKFKKVPRRRKARYLGGDGTQSAETAQRVRELGEVLKEYQGRIEIKTVREFIALSKHQCELAGMVIASEREMKGSPVFQVVGYQEAYGLEDKDNVNVDSRFHGNDGVSVDGSEDYIRHSREGGNPSSVRSKATALDTSACHANGVVKSEYDGEEEYGSSAPVGKRLRERGKGEDEWLVMSEPEGRVENCPSTARTSGESASPGVPFCDTFGHAKVSKEKSFEAIPLDPDKIYDLPRMPFYPDGTIPLPADGRWVRVDTPDGPMAMRMLNPQEPEYYIDDDVWEDDCWEEEWDDDP